MNNFPLVVGREPRATNTLLVPRYGRGRFHLGSILNDAWRARLLIMAQDERVYDFILLLRTERSHKKCAPYQVRFLLYALPFGFGLKTSFDEEGRQFLHDTYYLPPSYSLTWLDFSEKKYGNSPDFRKNLLPLKERHLQEMADTVENQVTV